MHAPPTQGIKGIKPRFKSAKEELPRLSKEYMEIRNRQMRAKAFLAETQAARARGQLLERKLVEFQASYLLIAMRQRILRLPAECAPQLAGLTDVHEIRMVLEGAARALLDEIKDLPSKVVDPRWIESLAEENGEKPGPPSEQGKPLRKRPSQTAAPGRRKPAATN